MKLIYPAVLVGAALVGVAAFAPSLAQKEPSVHHMTVWLPGGGTETISYTGSAPPRVTLHPPTALFGGSRMAAFGIMPSFVALDRLSEEMDREMGALIRQAETLPRLTDGSDMTDAALQTLPTDGVGYSLISQSIGSGTCTRMVQVIRRANSEKPEVQSRTSGHCTSEALVPKEAGVTPQPTSTASPISSTSAL